MTARDKPGDRGASAVLIAFSMVLLLGMAAVAVDAGIAFEDRRQQQAASDAGALAALQYAKTGIPVSNPDCVGETGAALAACRGAEEVIAVVAGTLPGRYPYDDPADLVPDWESCVDASKPAEFTFASKLSECISFTANFQKARVLLPGTDVDTAFARVIGFDSVAVSAFAEAGIDLNQSADVLPFAIGPTGANANQSCLFAQPSSTLNAAPCNGPVQGNFGKLDLALYGNTTYGTPQICGNGMPQLKIATNIVLGADHFIEENFVHPGTVRDFTNCPILTNPVDNLRTKTGNDATGIADGLWNGISAPVREGRITCKDGDPNEGNDISPTGSWPCRNVNNQMPESLDNTPLWHYLTGTNELSPLGACTGVTNRAEMELCLQAWRDYGAHTATESLFTDSLETAPRFGAVPQLATDPSVGVGDYDVVNFVPTYIETIYLKCNANTCDVVFSPGEPSQGAICDGSPPATPMTFTSCGWPSNGNKAVVAVTGFMLQKSMLHPDTREFFPGQDGTAILNLTR